MFWHGTERRQSPLRRAAAGAILLLTAGIAPAWSADPTPAPNPAKPAAAEAAPEAEAPPAPAAAEPSGLAVAAAMEQVLGDVISRCEPSVVAIGRQRPESERGLGFSPSARAPADVVPYEYGTGVVIQARGLVLTHYHVVRDGDTHFVTTADRRTHRAIIKGADPRSGLAVLELQGVSTELTPIRFGDSAGLRKGQFVLTLGNPYAIARDGAASASWGIVANLARKASPEPTEDTPFGMPTLHHFGTLIQTDARLNLGTSGSPLLNLKGEMIGLTTSIAAITGYESAAGYAIPVDTTFRRVVETLEAGREVEYGFLGIQPAPDQRGVRIERVVPGAPADRFKLRRDDVILRIEEEPVFAVDDVMLYIGRHAPDDNVRITVLRDGRTQRVDVQLDKSWVEGHKVVTNPPPAWRGLRVDYATALKPSELPASDYAMDVEGCVLVREVEEGTPAWKEGLRERMYVTHVGGERVRRPQEFYAAVAGANGPVQIKLSLPAEQQPNRTIKAP